MNGCCQRWWRFVRDVFVPIRGVVVVPICVLVGEEFDVVSLSGSSWIVNCGAVMAGRIVDDVGLETLGEEKVDSTCAFMLEAMSPSAFECAVGVGSGGGGSEMMLGWSCLKQWRGSGLSRRGSGQLRRRWSRLVCLKKTRAGGFGCDVRRRCRRSVRR